MTGLPRSRTAWFSVACASSGRTCYHEPTAWLGDDGALRDLWTSDVGISDSMLGKRLGWALDVFGPRTLVIERPRKDVIASANRYVGDRYAFDQTSLCETLRGWEAALAIHHPLIRRVGFAELNEFSTLCACFDWLGVAPHMLTQLQHMRIESDLDFNLQLLNAQARG